MQITVTDAKNRFGYFCSRAKSEPARKKEFDETYREWIAAQNRDFEDNGLWCEGLVAWQQS
jgi:hypothetical protein